MPGHPRNPAIPLFEEPMTRESAIKGDKGEIILYQTPDGRAELDVRLEGDTLWLAQKQLAALFETERSVITKHLQNIFRTGELDRESVCANFAHTAEGGKTYQTPGATDSPRPPSGENIQ